MFIPRNVIEGLRKLEECGFEAWLVGGCVRDQLMAIPPHDWDATTNATPEQIMHVFGSYAFPTGLKHGTVTVDCEGTIVEITTYRKDGTYKDHRRPEQVEFTASLEEDLKRRDFTMNAIAMDLRGNLQDPMEGEEDLRHGILRAVGDASVRFEEDALRILRGLRFASRFTLQIEKKTAKAMGEKSELLDFIAKERILEEVKGIIRGEGATEILRSYVTIFGVFWPELLPMIGMEQHNIHHCYDLWEHTLHVFDGLPKEDTNLRIAGLLHDVGKVTTFRMDENGVGHFIGHAKESVRIADQMLRNLKFSTEDREDILLLVDWHDRLIPEEKKSVKRALNRLGETTYERLMKLKRADNLAQAEAYRGRQIYINHLEELEREVLDEQSCFSLKQLAINGRDLISLGYQGQEIGKKLEEVLNLVIDDKLENRKEVLLKYCHE